MTSKGAAGFFFLWEMVFDVSYCQRFCCQEQIFTDCPPLALLHFTKPRICSFHSQNNRLIMFLEDEKRGECDGVCVCVCASRVHDERLPITNVGKRESWERNHDFSVCSFYKKSEEEERLLFRNVCTWVLLCSCTQHVYMYVLYCACICVAGVCLCVCTHAAIDRLAADSGLTSATSLAFCIAVFWLAASSCSSSSYWRRKESSHWLESTFNFHKLANIADQIRRHNPYICFTD